MSQSASPMEQASSIVPRSARFRAVHGHRGRKFVASDVAGRRACHGVHRENADDGDDAPDQKCANSLANPGAKAVGVPSGCSRAHVAKSRSRDSLACEAAKRERRYDDAGMMTDAKSRPTPPPLRQDMRTPHTRIAICYDSSTAIRRASKKIYQLFQSVARVLRKLTRRHSSMPEGIFALDRSHSRQPR